MYNIDLRNAIKRSGLHGYEVAEALGISETSFSRKMARKELPEDQKQKIFKAIKEAEKIRNSEIVDAAFSVESKAEMSADEMFQKEGYRVDKSLSAPGMVAYWNKGTRAKIWIGKDTVQYVPGDERGFRMNNNVLLACAQLIKEMEEKK